MAGTPAYKKSVKVATSSSGDFEELPATTASLDDGNDLLDDTDLTSSGTRSRVLGLSDWSISVTLNWNSTDSGLEIIRNAKSSRSTIYIQYLPDGDEDNGFQGPVVVENFNFSGGVEDLETVDVNMSADGLLGSA